MVEISFLIPVTISIFIGIVTLVLVRKECLYYKQKLEKLENRNNIKFGELYLPKRRSYATAERTDECQFFEKQNMKE